MHRFINHWRRYVPVSEDARMFLLQNAAVKHYGAHAHFMRVDEHKPYWCFVLEGLVFGYTLYEDGRRRIHWFAPPMLDFAGVRHLYTRRQARVAIQFARPTTLLRIPAMHMLAAKNRYPEVNELVQVQKQKRLDQRDQVIELVQLPDVHERYTTFLAAFPEISAHTTGQQQADFLNMSRSLLFEVRRWTLKRK